MPQATREPPAEPIVPKQANHTTTLNNIQKTKDKIALKWGISPKKVAESQLHIVSHEGWRLNDSFYNGLPVKRR